MATSSVSKALLFGMALVLLPACSVASGAPTALPTSVAATASPTTTATPVPSSQPTATASAAATATATNRPPSTPTPSETLDATRAADMTLEAIRLAVTASGVPEGSTAFDAEVAATQCAIVPPPTSTPLPWQLAPQKPYLVGANCLGNDLPGNNPRIWQEGRWIEAQTFLFSVPADLDAARKQYLGYVDLISFHGGAPGPDFVSQLAARMNSTGVVRSPQSCLADDVSHGVAALATKDEYVKLTFMRPIQWGQTYHLFISPVEFQLALPWSTSNVRQQLIRVSTGATLKDDTLSLFAGTAWLTYDTTARQWYVADDDSGYYCRVLSQFVP